MWRFFIRNPTTYSLALSDDTSEIVAKYKNQIIYVRHDNNQGVSAARNSALKIADTDLVAFLDDDDTWTPEKLLLQRPLFEKNPELLFSFTNFFIKFRDGRILNNGLSDWGLNLDQWEQELGSPTHYSNIHPLPEGIEDFPVYIGNFYKLELQQDYVLPNTFILRRQPALEAETLYFNKDITYLESWDFMARISKLGDGAYLHHSTSWHYGHDLPRLTLVSWFEKTLGRIRIMESHWGKDRDFLQQHQHYYDQKINRERNILINKYLKKGKFPAAKQEMKKLTHPLPLTLKLLKATPTFLLIPFYQCAKGLKKLLRL